jgi:hypothetical protein
LVEHVTRREHADAQWGLLVIEFRVHAARDPDLNLRYARLHERTLAGVARVVATIYEQAGDPPPLPPADLATLLVTVSSGARLEHATNPDVLPVALVAELVSGFPSSFDVASAGGRRQRRRVA